MIKNYEYKILRFKDHENLGQLINAKNINFIYNSFKSYLNITIKLIITKTNLIKLLIVMV